ncbi:hypothetical protein L1987_06624 [Smallanthus sonchifolius]|uniref:Uncharacterized protein n=1 Tax=Smallanthus sonchifolius TaxID=185202 RepID=A0ACB9JYN2_9ASTR|nr:hypothetical protein L1987_06624 [Smallanthus sonchifolius]
MNCYDIQFTLYTGPRNTDFMIDFHRCSCPGALRDDLEGGLLISATGAAPLTSSGDVDVVSVETVAAKMQSLFHYAL